MKITVENNDVAKVFPLKELKECGVMVIPVVKEFKNVHNDWLTGVYMLSSGCQNFLHLPSGHLWNVRENNICDIPVRKLLSSEVVSFTNE